MLVEDVRGPRFDEPAGCTSGLRGRGDRGLPTQSDRQPPARLPVDRAAAVLERRRRVPGGGEDGKLSVLKEARRSAGVDANGRSARQRLQTEHRNLQVLDGTGIAPEPLRLFGVLEHAFLEMEFLGGQTLSARTVAELPELRARGHRGAVAATYADASTEIARGLFEAVELAHNCGVVVGDLHPSNVMLSPALRVRLIDMEDHREPHERGRSPFNALGYRAPDGLDAAASDWYAFTRPSHRCSIRASRVNSWLRTTGSRPSNASASRAPQSSPNSWRRARPELVVHEGDGHSPSRVSRSRRSRPPDWLPPCAGESGRAAGRERHDDSRATLEGPRGSRGCRAPSGSRASSSRSFAWGRCPSRLTSTSSRARHRAPTGSGRSTDCRVRPTSWRRRVGRKKRTSSSSEYVSWLLRRMIARSRRA